MDRFKIGYILPLFQLFLAAFAIYSAIEFSEEIKLLVPLGCLLLMLLIIQIDKGKVEKKAEGSNLSKKDQDFSSIESLLWPKNELLLIDAIHFIFKDLGFKISTAVNYHSVDRIVKIPDRVVKTPNLPEAFGLEILMSEGEADKNHPKLRRALEFEKEKKENEKTLIIASTHIHLPLAERDQTNDISQELIDFLTLHHMSFMTAYSLYELWQKAKKGENDIFRIFQGLYSHSGGIFPLKGIDNSQSLLVDLSTPLDSLQK